MATSTWPKGMEGGVSDGMMISSGRADGAAPPASSLTWSLRGAQIIDSHPQGERLRLRVAPTDTLQFRLLHILLQCADRILGFVIVPGIYLIAIDQNIDAALIQQVPASLNIHRDHRETAVLNGWHISGNTDLVQAAPKRDRIPDGKGRQAHYNQDGQSGKRAHAAAEACAQAGQLTPGDG